MQMNCLSRGFAVAWIALGACGDSAAPLRDGAADAGASFSGGVLVLGDSYMTWNEERGSSIPMILADELAIRSVVITRTGEFHSFAVDVCTQ